MSESAPPLATVGDAKRADRMQRAAAVRERRAAAYRMRLQGHSFRAVAAALGVSLKTAFADVQRELAALSRHANESLAARRSVMLGQLDALKVGLHAKASGGDARSAEVMVKVIDREAKLTGVDAPLRAIVATREVGAPGDAWRVLAAAAATTGAATRIVRPPNNRRGLGLVLVLAVGLGLVLGVVADPERVR